MYLFLTALGLHCFVQAFSSCRVGTSLELWRTGFSFRWLLLLQSTGLMVRVLRWALLYISGSRQHSFAKCALWLSTGNRAQSLERNRSNTESDLLFRLTAPQLRVQHEHDRSHLCDPGLQQGVGGRTGGSTLSSQHSAECPVCPALLWPHRIHCSGARKMLPSAAPSFN